MSSGKFAKERERLVNKLIQEGILKDPRVIKAMRRVPREEFVPERYRQHAYIDSPLPTLNGQTISAPHMVAMMCELLKLDVGQKVLEVGTGSGYHAAVCAEIVAPSDVDPKLWGHVYSIERIPQLASFARSNLKKTGYDDRVTVIVGDGTLGYPPAAPYDRILVTAAAPSIPKPLIEQLAVNGRIVVPVGGSYYQELVVGVKISADEIRTYSAGGCVFVPLIGRYGWRF
ncbi:MAG: protein-L-isoaspartate O-methyltransferase [Candidatus Methanomethylicota archaeon]|uniref:Protein-L-isoaspartate O-methyltransferase n=1 Tax=Thermoproteota archaeon TaxID=2056631 RepID=A0A497F8V3_9CREN|nr:MAG: protein-L-isoaspartate O-methyltransferase [Candidatus Verstraetearchaeota archaeon]RLE55370.1 MAG: protein-L-isoaspartate O-methyltransferase [Candidatus Verstraetearchaeota archaeon]